MAGRARFGGSKALDVLARADYDLPSFAKAVRQQSTTMEPLLVKTISGRSVLRRRIHSFLDSGQLPPQDFLTSSILLVE
jgi:hypothetical protein